VHRIGGQVTVAHVAGKHVDVGVLIRQRLGQEREPTHRDRRGLGQPGPACQPVSHRRRGEARREPATGQRQKDHPGDDRGGNDAGAPGPDE
jgi:hypothetical protein